MPPPSASVPPLTPLLEEINKAASQGLFFLAVSMTVALPDICASLASPNGQTTGPKYKQWCLDNLGSDFSHLTPDDIWSLRCGVLHNGSFGDVSKRIARVILKLPGNVTHINALVAGDGYVYSVVEFCKNFTDAVDRWFQKNINDPNIKTNLPNLMQYRFRECLPITKVHGY